MSNNKRNLASSTGVIAALASSLCCIAPLLSIIGGVSGSMTMFDWIAPYRPYLIVLSVIALSYAFYQAYKPKPIDSCGCSTEDKSSFLSSKKFLWTITITSILMFTFPYYSQIFYSPTEKETLGKETKQVTLSIEGMTCKSCENHVNEAGMNISGVFKIETSYENNEVHIEYMPDSVSTISIMETINNETGYNTEIKNHE